MNTAFAAEQLADHAQRFAAFTGVARPNPMDRFFLVMGMTGAGKSTFVGRCTGKDVTIGHGLNSCTDSIDVFDFSWNGRRIYMVDTPGFNDTNRPDIETLGVLATYLGASYANGVRIHGLILLHPISDNRMTGSSLRNIEMMKAMCGFTSYANLAIATTMWPSSPDYPERVLLENRSAELLADGRFFGDLVARGATVFRHNEGGRRNPLDEATSAQRIVAHLIHQSDMHAPDVLRLQREIVKEGKTLGETAAGIAVAGELCKARKAHKRELRELEAELKGKLAQVDASHAARVQELMADAVKRLEKAEKDKKALKRSMEQMHEDEERAWAKKLRDLDLLFRKQVADKEQELLDMEESMLEIRRDMARRARRRSRTQRQIELAAVQMAEQEEMVNTARAEVTQLQDAHQKFKGQTGNIINGTTNGVAAGLTSGLIAAAAGGAGMLLCTVM